MDFGASSHTVVMRDELKSRQTTWTSIEEELYGWFSQIFSVRKEFSTFDLDFFTIGGWQPLQWLRGKFPADLSSRVHYIYFRCFFGPFIVHRGFER